MAEVCGAVQTTFRPGVRSGAPKRWCAWLYAIAEWDAGDVEEALNKSYDAHASYSIRVQYKALSEIYALRDVLEGQLDHKAHCVCKCHPRE